MKRPPHLNVFSMLIFVSLFGYNHAKSVCMMPEFVVTRPDDIATGSCSLGDCSLRQAITASNMCPGVQTVRIPVGTYTLTVSGAAEDGNLSGDLDILDSVNIVTVGMPVVDGNNADRVFDIKPAATVQMTGLIIQNGIETWGGGIMNAGTLQASKVLIQGNHDRIGGSAAGVFNSGNAYFTHSAIVNNVSFEEAAGIHNIGSLKLDNVTISGNQGYGVMNGIGSGTVEVEFSTIADNPGAYEIFNAAPPEAFRIGNSIVAGHVADGNCFAPITSTGYNIDTSSLTTPFRCGLDDPSDLNEINPNLSWLGSYGGLTPVRALSIGSPAVDTADPARCFGSDQRGILRPYGPACDRGAFELNDINPNPNETPTPTPTGTPAAVTKEPTKEPVKEFDEDGDGYSFNKDCNDKDAKINPDAFEIPNDKVDSNCNGEDDK
jgi:hypothetical protein